jgi:hypothetical protein
LFLARVFTKYKQCPRPVDAKIEYIYTLFIKYTLKDLLTLDSLQYNVAESFIATS